MKWRVRLLHKREKASTPPQNSDTREATTRTPASPRTRPQYARAPTETRQPPKPAEEPRRYQAPEAPHYGTTQSPAQSPTPREPHHPLHENRRQARPTASASSRLSRTRRAPARHPLPPGDSLRVHAIIRVRQPSRQMRALLWRPPARARQTILAVARFWCRHQRHRHLIQVRTITLRRIGGYCHLRCRQQVHATRRQQPASYMCSIWSANVGP